MPNQGHSHGHCHSHQHGACSEHEHSHEHHHEHGHGCCHEESEHHHGKEHHQHQCCHEHYNCHEHNHEDFAHELLEIADEAWMEVLRCKIKHHIENTSGKHLDQLAQLVVESNRSRWKHKIGAQRACSEYEEKVAEHLCCD